MKNKNAFKVIFIGPGGAGKTCIINRLLRDTFEDVGTTTGASYCCKSITLEDHSFTADIWDTSGRERYMALTKIYVKDADGVFVVYDITNKNSFDNMDYWLRYAKDYGKEDVSIMFIGNKCDLKKNNREVTEEEVELKAKKYGANFIEVSALSGENIQQAFEILIRKMVNLEMEDYETKYNKLKKNYDILKKDYDILKNELDKDKNIISNFDNKFKENLNEINNLKNNIRQKDSEIFNLLLKIKNIESFNKTSFNKDDIMHVHFISSDQHINCPIKCLKTDTFAEVEEKLYQKYQEYRETNNNFVSKGISIMRFKKIIENNITDGDKIELINLE